VLVHQLLTPTWTNIGFNISDYFHLSLSNIVRVASFSRYLLFSFQDLGHGARSTRACPEFLDGRDVLHADMILHRKGFINQISCIEIFFGS